MSAAESNPRTSVAEQFQGPWMKPEVLGALPQLKRDYERNADPELEASRQHAQRPDAERQRHSVIYEARRRRSAEQNTLDQREDSEERGDSGRGETDQSGRVSNMVSRDQPAPSLKPSPRMAHGVDAAQFRFAWLKEQRDAAMAQARAPQEPRAHRRSHDQSAAHQHSEPEP